MRAGRTCDKCGGSMFAEAAVSTLGRSPGPELSCMNCGYAPPPAEILPYVTARPQLDGKRRSSG